MLEERFKTHGRMLPENVSYQASWITCDGSQCFQIMEAPDLESMAQWTSKWDDLVEFKISPILTSSDYWAKKSALR